MLLAVVYFGGGDFTSLKYHNNLYTVAVDIPYTGTCKRDGYPLTPNQIDINIQTEIQII